MTSFNINYLLKELFPNTVTLAVKISTYEFWWDKIYSKALKFESQPLVLKGNFVLQGIFSNIWDIFGCHNLREGFSWHLVVEKPEIVINILNAQEMPHKRKNYPV